YSPGPAALQHLVQPTDRRVRVLPVNHERNDFFPGPQMESAVKVLGGFAPRAIRDEGLLADWIPALRDRSFEINLTLIAGQGRDLFPARGHFRKDFPRLKIKARFLRLAPVVIPSARAL